MSEGIFGLFIGLVAVLMVSIAILIPIVRFAFGSWIDRLLSLLEARQRGGSDSPAGAIRQMEQRLSLIERQLEVHQHQLQESAERNAFYERLVEPQLQDTPAEYNLGRRT